MKKFKSILITLLLVFCLSFPLVACDANNKKKGDDNPPAKETAEQVLENAYQNSLKYGNLAAINGDDIVFESFTSQEECIYYKTDKVNYVEFKKVTDDKYNYVTFDTTNKKYTETSLTKAKKVMNSNIILDFNTYYNACKSYINEEKESLPNELKALNSCSDLTLKEENGTKIVSFEASSVSGSDSSNRTKDVTTFVIYINDGLVSKMNVFEESYKIGENNIVETVASSVNSDSFNYLFSKEKLFSFDKTDYTKAGE